MSQQQKWGLHHFPRCFFLFCHTHLLPAVPAHTSTSDGGSSSPGHRVRTLESNITNVIDVLSQLSPRAVEPGQGCPEPGQETSPHLGNISITWSFPSLWLLFRSLPLFSLVSLSICGFAGKQFWVFKDTVLQPGYPKDIAQFGHGMPAQSIEAAVWWEDVAKTYFFKGDRWAAGLPRLSHSHAWLPPSCLCSCLDTGVSTKR